MNQNISNFVNKFISSGKDLKLDREELISTAIAKGIDIDELEIYIENELTSLKQIQNSKTCPKCGAIRNDLSLVCENCGFIFKTEYNDDGDDNLHISKLRTNVNTCINRIQALPEIGFIRTMFISLPYIFFLFSLFFLIMYEKSNYGFINNVYLVLFLLNLIIAFVSFMRRSHKALRYKNAISVNTNEYLRLTSEYDKYERQVRLFYSNNIEARNLITKFQNEIQKIAKKRKKNILVVNITYILIFVFAILFYLYQPNNEDIIEGNKAKFISNYGNLLNKELHLLPYYDSIGSQGLNKYIRLQNISVSANFDFIQSKKYDEECNNLMYSFSPPNGLIFRVNKVKISSSGLAYNDNENIADIYLTLRLLDKDRKEIAEIMSIKEEPTSLHDLINNANGDIYIDFTSSIFKDPDINTINKILDNTVYFSINLESK